MHVPRWSALATCILAGLVFSLPLGACGGSVSDALGALDAGESTSEGPSGSVSVQMSLPVGSLISKASYTLTGPSAFYRSSTMNFPGTREIAFGIDQVPASDGYNLYVTLTSPDGSNVCTSSGQFGVTGRMTTTVVLIPHCSQPPVQAAPTSGLQLTVELPVGVSITNLAFSLAGANGFRMQDSWSVANNSALLFVVQNIPAGMGDVISLSATTSDGAEVCSAGTTVNFAPNATTKAILVLQCQGVAGGADL